MKSAKVFPVVSVALMVYLLTPLLALAAKDFGTFEAKPIGPALGNGTLKMEITLCLNGREVKEPVEVKTGNGEGEIKVYQQPARMPDEPLRDYAQRVLNAQGEASHQKAKAIVDAINKKFEPWFKKLPRMKRDAAKAAADFTTVKKTVKVEGQNVPDLEAPFGRFTIPNVCKEKKKDPATGQETEKELIVWENKILGEGGKGRFIPDAPPAPMSPGMKGSLERTIPDVTNVASGYDPLGDTSFVEFGIDELYVAHYEPMLGDTDDSIFRTLEQLLDDNGLPATYDSSFGVLRLDTILMDGESLVWENTDTGLEFKIAFEAVQTVPEPGAVMLLLIGVFPYLAQFRRRHAGTVDCRSGFPA